MQTLNPHQNSERSVSDRLSANREILCEGVGDHSSQSSSTSGGSSWADVQRALDQQKADQRIADDRRAYDDRIASERRQNNGGNGGQSNDNTGNQQPSYMQDQFRFVAPSLDKHGYAEVQPGLTGYGANEPGRVTMHDIDRAAELNRKFLEDNVGSYPPHAENRLVVDYNTDQSAHLVRHYDKVESKQEGSWTSTEGQTRGMTPDQIQENLQLPHRPSYQTQVETPEGQSITRSFVGGSPSPEAKQYIVPRTFSSFFGEKKL